MSTRYVWDKYNYTFKYEESASSGYMGALSYSFETSDLVDGKMFQFGSAYRVDESNGLFSITANKGTTNAGIWIDATTNKYITCALDSWLGSELAQRFLLENPHSSGYWWIEHVSSSGGFVVARLSLVSSYGSNAGITYTKHRAVEKYEKTNRTGRVSHQSQAQYPTDGVGSGSLYYVYLGSDSIDPTAISYSDVEPRAGETITVTVTPAKNTYGGTISYQYQYSINGGSWANSGSKTTSTTKSFTVPSGSKQFRVRVVASDDMGFTSTTYVTGANLPVISMRVYAGINGAARRVGKMYIGVNEKARKVVKGYIGDADGKARLLF